MDIERLIVKHVTDTGGFTVQPHFQTAKQSNRNRGTDSAGLILYVCLTMRRTLYADFN